MATKTCFYIFLSVWRSVVGGSPFFKKFPLASFLIFAGFFPQPTTFGKMVWTAFTPQSGLERFMAQAGALGLRAMGQVPTVTWDVISLPTGSVRVDWGCSGFDLATIAAVTSLLLGIFWKQPLWKTWLFVVMGIAFSLIANVPRIMLMTLLLFIGDLNLRVLAWFLGWTNFPLNFVYGALLCNVGVA